jgi:hypothetical protein
MSKKIIVNCETGVVTEEDLTPEEIAQREADAIAWADFQAQIEADRVAKENAKASASAKLAALGLTEEEITAMLG